MTRHALMTATAALRQGGASPVDPAGAAGVALLPGVVMAAPVLGGDPARTVRARPGDGLQEVAEVFARTDQRRP